MVKNNLEKIHEHHIIPKYKCEELGIDKDFTGNTIYLTRLEHAWIHWWMWCNEKKDVYDLLESKGVDLEGIQMPNSTGCIKNHIPWQDKRDIGATQLCALGEIDGIDTSGENNPMYGRKHTEETLKKMSIAKMGKNNVRYIDGRTKDKEFKKAWQKEYWQRPEINIKKKTYDKKYRQTPEVIAKRRERQQTPEYKAWKKEYIQRPENIIKKKAYDEVRYHRIVEIQYFINQGLVL